MFKDMIVMSQGKQIWASDKNVGCSHICSYFWIPLALLFMVCNICFYDKINKIKWITVYLFLLDGQFGIFLAINTTRDRRIMTNE